MTDLDALLAQVLALVDEDKRGELADVIEQIITQAQAAANDFWLTRIYDWDPTPATDAIWYALTGRATRNPDESHLVYKMIQAARARMGKAEAAHE
jgi:hypothetical protein